VHRIFCDECHKEMMPEDFQRLEFRGNNIIFTVKIEGLGTDYCYGCIVNAVKNAVPLKEFKL